MRKMLLEAVGVVVVYGTFLLLEQVKDPTSKLRLRTSEGWDRIRETTKAAWIEVQVAKALAEEGW